MDTARVIKLLNINKPYVHEILMEELDNVITSAYDECSKRNKPSSMLSVFRIANDQWRAFTRSLKNKTADQIDGAPYENLFMERLSTMHPEIYMLCLNQRIFPGHQPSSEQFGLIRKAEDSLKRDKQHRLALTIYNMIF